MPGCAVFGCKNYSKVTSRLTQDEAIRYFRFPKEDALLKQWTSACGRDKPINLKNATVCSVHFEPSCFREAVTEQVIDYKSKNIRNLRPNAVPTLLLPGLRKRLASETETTHGKKLSQALRSDIVDDPLEGTSTMFLFETNLLESTANIRTAAGPSENTTPHDNTTEETSATNDKIIQTDAEIDEINMKNAEIQTLQQKIIVLEEKLKNMEANLSKLFTPGQIKKIIEPTKRIRWKPSDIASAVSLRSVSPKAYRYLKSKEYPLPGLSTLRKWAATFSVEPGILTDVVTLMKEKGKEMTSEERLCVLSFDEMYISNRMDIEKKIEQKIGPHTSCQVVMSRGLIGHWKQPVFYDFDVALNREILTNLVSSLYDAGYIVVAVVSDMGTRNMQLWKELNIGYDKSCCISHPSNETLKIFFMADVPHLIKLLRNHFLDDNLFIEGKQIDKNCIYQLTDISTSELTIAHKITKYHFEVKGTQRQKVKPAVQLFSNTVSKAVEYIGKNGLISSGMDWKNTSDFILQVNNWFDLFNSRTKFKHNSPYKSAFGTYLEEQTAFLSRFENTITNMTIGTHKSLLPFQKGILLSSKSLQQLFHYIQSKYEVDYILTFRLNQDVLENFFSYIRGMGHGNEHPSPLEVKYRLRWYILGRDSNAVFTENLNTEERGEENLLTPFEDSGCLSSDMFHNLTKDIQMEVQDENTEAFYFVQPEYFQIEVEENSISEEHVQLLEEFESKEDISNQCLRYIAGYIAYKLKNKFNLGVPSQNVTQWSKEDWLPFISEGKLFNPNEEFMEATLILEKEFSLMHGNSLSSGKYLFKDLAERTMNKLTDSNLPYEAIYLLSKTRTYIRLNHLNRTISVRNCKRKLERKLFKFSNKKM